MKGNCPHVLLSGGSRRHGKLGVGFPSCCYRRQWVYIREGCSKPRLRVFLNLLAGVWLPSPSLSSPCVRAHEQYPLAITAMRKSIHVFSFLSYVSIVLSLTAFRAARTLLWINGPLGIASLGRANLFLKTICAHWQVSFACWSLVFDPSELFH